ncbi:MAG: hypothetical protein WCH40_13335 [Verrucomicrobiales bacterium]
MGRRIYPLNDLHYHEWFADNPDRKHWFVVNNDNLGVARRLNDFGDEVFRLLSLSDIANDEIALSAIYDALLDLDNRRRARRGSREK